MVRISTHYRLGRAQSVLDFVDVDTSGDSALFVDPRALLLLETQWGRECVSLIQDFFSQVLRLIALDGDPVSLLGELHEPNETRLGLSVGRAQGRAIGPELARALGDALARSEAVQSGLLQDLEDTILMIPGIGPDMISDIATNVIRAPLIQYTQWVASEYGIPLADDVYLGPTWDPNRAHWQTHYQRVPVADGRPLVLVPKAIVRRHMDYDPDEYFDNFIIPHLRAQELDSASELVYLLKNGRTRVTRKGLVAKYGSGKLVSERITLQHPELLDAYRHEKQRVRPPLTYTDFALVEGSPTPEWDRLLEAVVSLPAGADSAGQYQDAVKDLMTAIFYPALTAPRKEVQIHGGRKRIDITFANAARSGFFDWLGEHYNAPYVFVECKNYQGDPANPELDQLAGRFSRRRGRFGLLACRTFTDKALFISRCRDTADDDRGYIVCLDDGDLAALVEARKTGDQYAEFPYLRQRFEELIL